MRIVSLLPAATEMVCQLGLEGQLVGVSHECDYPPTVTALPKVTSSHLHNAMSSEAIDAAVRETLANDRSLYKLDVEQLVDLRPDVIVTQSLCNVCAVSDNHVDAALSQLGNQPRVVRLSPTRWQDILTGMQQIATACQAEQAADKLASLSDRVQRIRASAQAAQSMNEQRSTDQPPAKPRVMMLEWIDPLFSAGHWNPELIEMAGGISVLGITGQPSRRLEWSEIRDADPDVLFVACCGFSIDRTVEDMPTLVSYPGFAKLKCVASGQVFLADGNAYFNRPGPRLVDSLELLSHALFPDRHQLASHIEAAVRVRKV